MSDAQQIEVNGKPISVPGDCTVEVLLGLLEIHQKRVAVALNRDVVPRSDFGNVVLHGGDRIEILEAVGGG